MIGTDCTGSCKTNYHTITTMTALRYLDIKWTSFILTVRSNAWHVLWNRTTTLSLCSVFNISWFGRLIVDWSVNNMTSEMTLYEMSLCLANN
jgi:hypothetical protein